MGLPWSRRAESASFVVMSDGSSSCGMPVSESWRSDSRRCGRGKRRPVTAVGTSRMKSYFGGGLHVVPFDLPPAARYPPRVARSAHRITMTSTAS